MRNKIMEIIKGRVENDIIIIRLDPEEDLLNGLNKIIKEENIKSGVVISGVGSLKKCRFHQVDAGNPPVLIGRKQKFIEISGSIEVSSLQGVIADGEPHLHITIGEGDKTYSGHLETGSIVFILFELVILRINAPVKRFLSDGPEKIKQIKNK